MSWYGMEQIVEEWLEDNDLPFIENTSEVVNFDFVITDEIPIIIEVKYARYGNRTLVEELFLKGLYTFGKFRFVLIVVGQENEAYRFMPNILSKKIFFDPQNVAEDEIVNAVKALLSNELLPLHKLPFLTQHMGAGYLQALAGAIKVEQKTLPQGGSAGW